MDNQDQAITTYRKVIVLIPNYWGIGDNEDEAIKSVEKISGRKARKNQRAVYEFEAKEPFGKGINSPLAFVDSMGAVCWGHCKMIRKELPKE